MAQREVIRRGLAGKVARIIISSRNEPTSSGPSPNLERTNQEGSCDLVSSNSLSEAATDTQGGSTLSILATSEPTDVNSSLEDDKTSNRLVGSRQSQEFAETAFEAVAPKFKRSLTSTLLKSITVDEARRQRTSSISCPTLLSEDELNTILPSRRLSVYIATFNMAGKNISEKQVQELLFPELVIQTADMYAIAVQEASPECSSKEFRLWEKRLQSCLSPCKQVLIRSVWMGVQHLVVFIRRELVWFVSDSRTFAKNTRPISNVKTKGAIAIWLKFFGTTFLFISCHLSHGPDILPRLSDCKRIETFFQARKFPARPGNLLDESDYVFWFGDMNFRLTADDLFIEKFRDSKPSTGDIPFMLDRDQLNDAIKEGRALRNFTEKAISFMPTYKMTTGTNSYAMELRWPAYTDRVLYKMWPNDVNDIECLMYDSISLLCTSDHKPVYAIFKVTVCPETQESKTHYQKLTPLHQILEGNRRLRTNKAKSQICSIT